MIHMVRALGATAFAVASCLGGQAVAQTKQLTLCWAAWDPANALVELSKDFTAKSGIQMKYEFVPWTSYADRFLNELNSKGKLCDLIIGDSQWIGGAAENGHYVKLNDFFAKEKITMDDFMPATVVGYSQWPKNTPNYWALPAMGDAIGWTYRKDWFARPEIQAEFKKKYERDLAPAADLGGTQADRRVLPGQGDRRQEGLRRLHLHRARLRRHHHGRDQRALRLGFPVRRSQEALPDGGLCQFARRGQGPRILQVAVQVLHRAWHEQRLHVRGARRLQVGTGRDADELLRVLSRAFTRIPMSAARRSASSSIRSRSSTIPSWAGRESRSSPTPSTRTTRSPTSNGSRSPTFRRSGGRWAAIPATRRCSAIRASPRARPLPPTS